MCGSDVFLGVLAILFPPLAVWVKRGICSADSLINLCLCVLGFLPGLIHAWYIIASYPNPTYEEVDAEGGRGVTTYYYVQQGQAPTPAQRGYGTLNQQQQQAGAAGQPAQNAQGQYTSPQHAPLPGPSGSEAAPPSYQDSIQGDNKVQRKG